MKAAMRGGSTDPPVPRRCRLRDETEQPPRPARFGQPACSSIPKTAPPHYTLRLTPEGQQLHDRIFDVAKERERRLLETLSPQELESLLDMLNRIHKQIDHVNAYRP